MEGTGKVGNRSVCAFEMLTDPRISTTGELSFQNFSCLAPTSFLELMTFQSTLDLEDRTIRLTHGHISRIHIRAALPEVMCMMEKAEWFVVLVFSADVCAETQTVNPKNGSASALDVHSLCFIYVDC